MFIAYIILSWATNFPASLYVLIISGWRFCAEKWAAANYRIVTVTSIGDVVKSIDCFRNLVSQNEEIWRGILRLL
jgi:hypothetical protein